MASRSYHAGSEFQDDYEGAVGGLEIHASETLKRSLGGDRKEGCGQYLKKVNQVIAAVQASANGLLYHRNLPEILYGDYRMTDFDKDEEKSLRDRIDKLIAEDKYGGSVAIICLRLCSDELTESALMVSTSSLLYCLALMKEDEKGSGDSPAHPTGISREVRFIDYIVEQVQKVLRGDIEVHQDERCQSYMTHVAELVRVNTESRYNNAYAGNPCKCPADYDQIMENRGRVPGARVPGARRLGYGDFTRHHIDDQCDARMQVIVYGDLLAKLALEKCLDVTGPPAPARRMPHPEYADPKARKYLASTVKQINKSEQFTQAYRYGMLISSPREIGGEGGEKEEMHDDTAKEGRRRRLMPDQEEKGGDCPATKTKKRDEKILMGVEEEEGIRQGVRGWSQRWREERTRKNEEGVKENGGEVVEKPRGTFIKAVRFEADGGGMKTQEGGRGRGPAILSSYQGGRDPGEGEKSFPDHVEEDLPILRLPFATDPPTHQNPPNGHLTQVTPAHQPPIMSTQVVTPTQPTRHSSSDAVVGNVNIGNQTGKMEWGSWLNKDQTRNLEITTTEGGRTITHLTQMHPTPSHPTQMHPNPLHPEPELSDTTNQNQPERQNNNALGGNGGDGLLFSTPERAGDETAARRNARLGRGALGLEGGTGGTSERGSELCAICHEHVLRDQKCTLHCKHVFCRGCIALWVGRKNRCPVCRALVNRHRPGIFESYTPGGTARIEFGTGAVLSTWRALAAHRPSRNPNESFRSSRNQLLAGMHLTGEVTDDDEEEDDEQEDEEDGEEEEENEDDQERGRHFRVTRTIPVSAGEGGVQNVTPGGEDRVELMGRGQPFRNDASQRSSTSEGEQGATSQPIVTTVATTTAGRTVTLNLRNLGTIPASGTNAGITYAPTVFGAQYQAVQYSTSNTEMRYRFHTAVAQFLTGYRRALMHQPAPNPASVPVAIMDGYLTAASDSNNLPSPVPAQVDLLRRMFIGRNRGLGRGTFGRASRDIRRNHTPAAAGEFEPENNDNGASEDLTPGGDATRNEQNSAGNEEIHVSCTGCNTTFAACRVEEDNPTNEVASANIEVPSSQQECTCAQEVARREVLERQIAEELRRIRGEMEMGSENTPNAGGRRRDGASAVQAQNGAPGGVRARNDRTPSSPNRGTGRRESGMFANANVSANRRSTQTQRGGRGGGSTGRSCGMRYAPPLSMNGRRKKKLKGGANGRRPQRENGREESNQSYSGGGGGRDGHGEERRSFGQWAADQSRMATQTLLAKTWIATLLMILLFFSAVAKGEEIHMRPNINNTTDQSTIKTYRAGPLLLFESWPLSRSLMLHQESVDIGILHDIQKRLDEVKDHANQIRYNQEVVLSEAENLCPRGYPSSITDVLDVKHNHPQYLDIRESQKRMGMVYTAFTYIDEEGEMKCNYSLNAHSARHMMNSLDFSSNLYNEDRRTKLKSYMRNLQTPAGEGCLQGVNVWRGQIEEEDATRKFFIPENVGSIYVCVESCRAANGMILSNEVGRKCVLGKDCAQPYQECKMWSFNWASRECRHSDQANNRLNQYWYEGFNALAATPNCAHPLQNQNAEILVNKTLMAIRSVCHYDIEAPKSSRHIYRSCPGQSDSVLKGILPLQAQLDRYTLELEMDKRREPTKKHELSLQNLTKNLEKRERRAAPLVVGAALSGLRPIITSFLTTGSTRLGALAASKYISGALPISSLLLLSGNLLAIVISLVVETMNPTASEPYVQYDPLFKPEMGSWELMSSPNLYTLKHRDPECQDLTFLNTMNLPSTLKELAEILNSLARPLNRIVHVAQPLSSQIQEEMKDAKVFAFWSTFDKKRRYMTRYFVTEVEGGPSSSTKQVAVLKGSDGNSIKEGTILAGSSAMTKMSQPRWACIEFAQESVASVKRLPASCYGLPSITRKFYYRTPFLPGAEVVRVIGNHLLQYKCPRTSLTTKSVKGLLVILVPNNCELILNGMTLRKVDLNARSAWKRPIVLVNKKKPYDSLKGPRFPKNLEESIVLITRNVTKPRFTDIARNITKGNKRLENLYMFLAITATGVVVILVVVLGVKCCVNKCCLGHSRTGDLRVEMPMMRQVVNQGPGKTKSYISASQYHFGDEDNQTRLMEHESWREAPNPEGDGSCMREEDGPSRIPRRANDDRPIQMGPGMNTT